MCDCPVCGATELDATTRLLNVRAYKVERDGLSWSECLVCRRTDGNGWFAIDDQDRIVIEPSRIAAMEARGEEVEKIAA